MKLLLRTFVVSSLLMLGFVISVSGQMTHTTISNGNWNSAATWQGGSIPPTASDIPATTTINIRHTVNYNTGNSIKNRGTIIIEPAGGSTAILNVPTNINVENFSGATFRIMNASLLQCRFVGCNNGQPYSGNNPGAPIQSGTFKNLGGVVELRSANVEVAQDWTNEGGIRLIVNSCVTTGQNYSVSNAGTVETITRSHISIGWHGSGNFDISDATVNFHQARVQLAGASGSFKLNSGIVNGDIDYITLRNHVVPFVGGGEIFASTSLSTAGIDLDAYCVSIPSKYIPNTKFLGTQTADCTLNYFPAPCSTLVPSAALVTIGGRVFSGQGYGIGMARVTLTNSRGQVRTVLTNGFGYYWFDEVEVGQIYSVHPVGKGLSFEPRIIMVNDAMENIDFFGSEKSGSDLPGKRSGKGGLR